MAQAARKSTLLHAVTPTATFEVVSPEVAAEWLGANEGNRRLRARTAESFARDIRLGRWVVTGEAIKFDYNGRLIDGQHRLNAIVLAGMAAELLVVRHLDPLAQSVIDTPARRSASDALVWAGLIEHNTVLAAAVGRLGYSIDAGMILSAGSGNGGMVTHGDILEWVREHGDIEPAVAWAANHSKAYDGRPAAVAYARYRLEQIDAQAAEIFFDQIINLSTKGAGDPVFALVTLLRTNVAVSYNSPATLGAYFVAWNAWRSKQKLSAIRLTDSKGKPIPLPMPV